MPRVTLKRKKFILPSKYMWFLITLLCIGIMILTFTTNWIAGPLEAISGYTIVPFQNGISTVGSWLTDRSDDLRQLKDVMAENQQLKSKLDELALEVNSLQQDKYELSRLRELYELDEKFAAYEKKGARVIAKDSGNWFNTFIIDKGSNDGFAVDMNVLAGSGLVGRIVTVGPNWSQVKSIIDDNSNVSAIVLSTSDKLMVSGDLELMQEGVIRFEQLNDEDGKVTEGEKVVTSYISDKYLPGIPIGYLSKIYVDSNNLTKSGQVTPIVDFKSIEEVLVILDLKKKKD